MPKELTIANLELIRTRSMAWTKECQEGINNTTPSNHMDQQRRQWAIMQEMSESLTKISWALMREIDPHS